MPSVPRISGKEAVATFEKAGFYVGRVSGAHHILKKDGHLNRLSIPVHAGKTLGIGLHKSQIVAAGLSVQGLIDLLES